MTKTFLRFLAAEVLVIAAVIAIFQVIENRIAAGLVAGCCFVALGLWIFISGLRTSRVRWSFSFWLAVVHLFISALPLMLTRLWNLGASFDTLLVLGLPGPVFHRLSTTIYSFLLVGTLIDVAWSFFRQRQVASKENVK